MQRARRHSRTNCARTACRCSARNWTTASTGPSRTLAALHAGVLHVPLPLFFTSAQAEHALRASGADSVLDRRADGALRLRRRTAAPGITPHDGTAKITFTSGTTGTPKGVCLSAEAMLAVAQGLAEALAPCGIERHLCALPLAVLLENIAGLMAPLPRAPPAWRCRCRARPERLVELRRGALHKPRCAHRPHSVILLPQMLRAWVGYWRSGQRAPDVAAAGRGRRRRGRREVVLARRARSGIPAYEGYGLSEGRFGADAQPAGRRPPGSAGRALPHARVRIAADGEIEIAGSLFRGYLGDPDAVPAWWPTGDLGSIDDDGFLHVSGRKKNVLITALRPQRLARVGGDGPVRRSRRCRRPWCSATASRL